MRSYLEFTVDLEPVDAVALLLKDAEMKEALVFQDYKVSTGADPEQAIAVLVLEKYFFRNNSTATLTITVSNFEGVTTLKCISTGNGTGLIDIGLWAGRSFIKPVRKILAPHILEIIDE
ncbi:DUF6054 family protein [Bacillus salacetis]|uniref:DUF6054 family protein n=1 Tax=Bacillus salacetis TaxID=2315464 RepID=UPI003BA00C6A